MQSNSTFSHARADCRQKSEAVRNNASSEAEGIKGSTFFYILRTSTMPDYQLAVGAFASSSAWKAVAALGVRSGFILYGAIRMACETPSGLNIF